MSDSLLSNVRYPSVPLIVHDPYFSIWSAHDHLNDGWESHWTGSGVGLCGLLRVDGSCCTFAGEPGVPRRFRRPVWKCCRPARFTGLKTNS